MTIKLAHLTSLAGGFLVGRECVSDVFAAKHIVGVH
jgi:hypothetical protein